jgi:hypothetical protein
MEEVESSILSSSTFRDRGNSDRAEAMFLGGLVAGEGYFSIIERNDSFADGSPRLRFRFGISMARRDRPMLERLQTVLGAGTIRNQTPKNPKHLPTAALTIDSSRIHRAVTIPFFEQVLLPSKKRDQFLRWRDALLSYERNRPTRWGRGAAPCTVEGCDKPVRGRGLCRSHYFRVTGY